MPLRRTTIAWSTCVFLVLLRLAIGWHFFFEGFEKYESVSVGPTDTSKPWSSASFLREATGPFAGFFHWQAGGDADEEALAKFDVQPLAPGQDPSRVKASGRIPPALDEAWADYYVHFVDFYGLDAAQQQDARNRLDQSKERAVLWLLGKEGSHEVENNDFPTATFKEKETPLERINLYRSKIAEIRRIEDRELPAFGKDTYRARLRTLKSDATRLRAELLADLNKPMQDNLASVLTPEQKQKGALPAPEPPAVLRWTDLAVMWTLLIVGGCLLLGLFTRPASLVGALFLLMLYLAMPPWPWLPENLRVEGHYLFVNKNLVEMLALLVLATVPTGRWAGLDGLVQFLNPWRWRSSTPAPAERRGLVAAPVAQTSQA
jgi:uncharacterized membrane protein YphA (DoxX/SURF4 family)